eukprot:TRINITY_DN5442_c0_g1_i3.p1 TRINITY_DN5442_c0_g1~~TRINITY_DN5442_c0_g1_i3.p1  ORF type:complete len:203 (-),score=20.35 TRINITY_DN5442_c0_g1_i3:244-822(-)
MEERGAVASPVQPGAMILPLPAIQITGESRYVRSMASVMFGALLLQSLGVTLRMFILLDIFGGFMIGLCVALGWYAWSKDMDLQLICFWGLATFVQGVFGLVRLLHEQVHSPFSLFDGRLPARYNVESSVRLLDPIFLVLGGLLAYHLYANVDRPLAENAPVGGGGGGGGFGAAARPSFQTFAGSGHRLGSG